MKALLLICSSLFFSTSFAQTLNETQGTASGGNITTGDYNTFYGDSSGFNITTGSYNTFLGYRAGSLTQANGSGSAWGSDDLLIIGANASGGIIPPNSYIFDNTILGTRAGFSNHASDVVFIGTEAGYNNTSGVDNVFIGEESGHSNTTGNDNVFLGEDAGFNNTIANDNTFLGNVSGRSNTTGFRNTFVGNESGFQNTTGYWNTFIGDSSGADCGVGYSNTFLGHGSGAATEHGSNNTFIGNYSGWDNNRTNELNSAQRNTYLGSRSGFSNREGSDNVVIGYNADFGFSGSFNPSQNNRNIIIGSGAELDNGRIGATVFGYDAYVNKNYGMAIGYSSNVTGDNGIALGLNTVVSATNGIAIGNAASANYAYSGAFGSGATADTTNAFVLGGTTATDRMTLGIGTSKPNQNASIDLAEDNKGLLLNRLSSTLRTNLGTTLSAAENGLLVYDTDSSAVFYWDGTDWVDMRSSSGDNLGNHTAAQNLQLNGNWISNDGDSEGVFVAANGFVGLGTATPNNELEINDPVASSAWMKISHAGATDGLLIGMTNSNIARIVQKENADIQFATNDVNKMVIKNNGNVGIGTLGPGAKLHVQGSIRMVDGNQQSGRIVLSDANGKMTWSDPSVFLDNTDAQTLSFAGSDLTISGGNTVDLSALDTDTQLTESEVDAFVANNGYLTSFVEVDGDATNEIQDISLSGTALTLSSGSTIDLSVIDTDTQLTESEVDAFVANNGYLTSFVEVDGDATNEIQDISLSGTALTLSSGSTIDLSVIDTDTDTQLTETEVDAFVANNGYLTSFVEVDGDATNEIQDISLSGTDLTLSSGSTIDLSAIDTDTDQQNLTAATLSGTTLEIEIENGASVSVDLAPLLVDLQNQITNIDDRLTIIEPCACDSTAGLWENNEEVIESAILYQNIPNPFNNTSKIKYYIPTWANSASLVFSNDMGQIVSNVDLHEVGDYGAEYVNAEGLASGMYYYSLYINQTLVDTKKMIVE